MSDHRFALLLIAALIMAHSGCAAITQNSRSMWRALRTDGNYADSTEGPDELWVQQAGDQARESHPRETATEPAWFRGLIMSDRARSIERNLGIDEN